MPFIVLQEGESQETQVGDTIIIGDNCHATLEGVTIGSEQVITVSSVGTIVALTSKVLIDRPEP